MRRPRSLAKKHDARLRQWQRIRLVRELGRHDRWQAWPYVWQAVLVTVSRNTLSEFRSVLALSEFFWTYPTTDEERAGRTAWSYEFPPLHVRYDYSRRHGGWTHRCILGVKETRRIILGTRTLA